MTVASSTRRIAATILAAGAVVAAVAVPATADDGAGDHRHQQRSQVEISRVQANSTGREDGSNRSLNGEWVEITNNSRHGVNLKGWTLKDEDGNR
ncbi:lamin tail domain-containing protein, partial [Streptomyces sp. NPDC093225]|uniref:lamin tail domain-containing protein n=1 Tax=Streptomyces sp. NPDC093225 TaxID=3366034 RepID=UPI0037F34CE4